MEIPRDEWDDFLEQYGLDHSGWIVDLEWPGEDVGGETEYVLDGIEAELGNGESQVVFSFEDRDDIVVDDPVRITLSEGEMELEDELIEIESERATLSLHLRFPEPEEERGTTEDLELEADEDGLPHDEPEPIEDELSVREERGL